MSCQTIIMSIARLLSIDCRLSPLSYSSRSLDSSLWISNCRQYHLQVDHPILLYWLSIVAIIIVKSIARFFSSDCRLSPISSSSRSRHFSVLIVDGPNIIIKSIVPFFSIDCQFSPKSSSSRSRGSSHLLPIVANIIIELIARLLSIDCRLSPISLSSWSPDFLFWLSISWSSGSPEAAIGHSTFCPISCRRFCSG